MQSPKTLMDVYLLADERRRNGGRSSGRSRNNPDGESGRLTSRRMETKNPAERKAGRGK
jgi:hypothetical protein